MKTLNADELKNVAEDIFERYPRAQKVSVTDDGMAFITDDGDLAVINHSVNNKHGKKLGITSFERDKTIVAKTTELKNDTELAAVMIEKIATANTVEAVMVIKDAELAGKKRVSVIKAAEEKLSELNANQ